MKMSIKELKENLPHPDFMDVVLGTWGVFIFLVLVVLYLRP